MSILDKKLYLTNLEERLNEFVPANEVRRILDQAAEALDDVSAMYLDQYLSERNDSEEALFIGHATNRLGPHGVRAMLKKHRGQVRSRERAPAPLPPDTRHEPHQPRHADPRGRVHPRA